MNEAVADLAVHLLAEVSSRLGADAPAHRYTHVGEVAYDCDQLVVSLQAISVTSTTQSPCAAMPEPEFLVVWTQCVATLDGSQLPSKAALESDARTAAGMAYTLLEALLTARMGKTLLPGVCDCETVRFGDVIIRGPEGGIIGVEIPLFVRPVR